MQENILIIGNGGREYSIALNLKQDNRISSLFFSPGNGATSNLGQNFSYENNQQLLDSIKKYNISLVIIGPEVPLVEGLSDFLVQNGIRVFGPSKLAARLEGSKSFMKDFATSANIPTARYIKSSDIVQIENFIDSLNSLPIVVKADGLCAGKGVIIAQSKQEAKLAASDMLSGKSFGESGLVVVVEEFLDGFELSVFAVCDGDDFILLPPCQDHKRLLDNDKGPNTGGMGAYTPTPLCNENLLEKIKTKIIAPTLKEAKKQGFPFSGVLFGGIMVVNQNGILEPYLLEFNVRFGDPECEVLMPLLKTPLLDIIYAVLDKKIASLKCEIESSYAVAVVVASKDYPYKSSTPQKINIKSFSENLGHIVYAGVSKDSSDNLLASGGRVLLCVGIAENLKQARDNAYKIVDSVHFEGMIYRKDIAHRAL